MPGTGFWLLDNKNPHGRDRYYMGQHFKGWFRHPMYREPIDLLFIHVTANYPDLITPDTKAEDVTLWQSRTDYVGSYNYVCDSDSERLCLPDEWIAYAVGGRNGAGRRFNNLSLSGSFAADRNAWESDLSWWANMSLPRMAKWVAKKAKKHNLPIVFRNREEILNGARGLSKHAFADPVNRPEDPGTNFPDSKFLNLVYRFLEDDKVEDTMAYVTSAHRVQWGSETVLPYISDLYKIPDGASVTVIPDSGVNRTVFCRIWINGTKYNDPEFGMDVPVSSTGYTFKLDTNNSYPLDGSRISAHAINGEEVHICASW